MCSKICASQQELDEFLLRLKITPCPHCKTVGNLIKHGFLRGYDSQHQLEKAIKATRLFCNNRGVSTTGCGRTFSVWIASRIKQCFLSAENLWRFLQAAVQSKNKLDAFRSLQCGLSLSATYHLWRRFANAQPRIRTALSRLCEPPPLDSNCSVELTLAHLEKAFQTHFLSPIAAFAVTFQAFLI
jgi:hypothetical protein